MSTSILSPNVSQQVINLQPVFITNEQVNAEVVYKDLPLYIIVLVEVFIAFLLLYYFFYQEIIFLYNQWKPKEKTYNSDFINKVHDLKNYNISCNEMNNVILTNHQEVLTAKYFDGNEISFKNSEECNNFLTKIRTG